MLNDGDTASDRGKSRASPSALHEDEPENHRQRQHLSFYFDLCPGL